MSDIVERLSALADEMADAHAEAAGRIGTIQAHIKAQAAEIARLRALLRRYRTETPLGHQPHMIAHEVDAALASEAPRAVAAAG